MCKKPFRVVCNCCGHEERRSRDPCGIAPGWHHLGSVRAGGLACSDEERGAFSANEKVFVAEHWVCSRCVQGVPIEAVRSGLAARMIKK